MQAELLDTGSLERSIEAVLFVASESLSIKALAKLTRSEEADVTVALQKIDADYASRGIVLREIAGGYRFATAPAARGVVEAYLMPPKTNLSQAALETLAIVAYMQPVTKGDIEGIRGVNADSVLSTLVDRRFLTEAGRKEVAGRPILYKTTPDFLEAFGLRSLEELPPIDVDADVPVEFAFPVALQAGRHAGLDEQPPDGGEHIEQLAGVDGQTEQLAGADGQTEQLAGADGPASQLAGADGQIGQFVGTDGRAGELAGADGHTVQLADVDGLAGQPADTDEQVAQLAVSDVPADESAGRELLGPANIAASSAEFHAEDDEVEKTEGLFAAAESDARPVTGPELDSVVDESESLFIP